MDNCPKCGIHIDNQDSESCLKCGVIFHKIRYVNLESIPMETPRRDYIEMFRTRKSWRVFAISLISVAVVFSGILFQKHLEARRLARMPKITISPDLRYRITTTYDDYGHKEELTEELRTPNNEEERQAIIKRNKLDEIARAEYFEKKAKAEEAAEEARRANLTPAERDKEDKRKREEKLQDEIRIENYRRTHGR